MKVRAPAAMMAVLMAVAVPAFAQERPQGPPARRGERADSLHPRMLSVESALRLKQELKLSDSQVNQLETLRKEIVAERQAQARDHIDLQSRVAAGLISEDEVRKQFEGKRDALRQTIEQRRDRIAKILTAEQQEQLQRQSHRHMMDRMHERRGRIEHGFRGRGRMGPGMPRWRDGI